MATVQVWSGADVTVNFAGIDIDEDAIPEDDFVKIEQMQPDFVGKKGIGGATTRCKVIKPMRKITIRLRQTASVNTVLSAIINLDRSTSGGSGIAPIIVKDKLGNFVYTDDQAYLTKDPTWTAGKEDKDLEWELESPNAKSLVGGH